MRGDFLACVNADCPRKDDCLRHIPPDNLRRGQTYFMGALDEKGDCEYHQPRTLCLLRYDCDYTITWCGIDPLGRYDYSLSPDVVTCARCLIEAASFSRRVLARVWELDLRSGGVFQGLNGGLEGLGQLQDLVVDGSTGGRGDLHEDADDGGENKISDKKGG